MNISHISACVILHRSDKQPDRVEISPEQLCTASTVADQLTHKLKRPMRVLGWYHSHPHITVWPSHVGMSRNILNISTYVYTNTFFFIFIWQFCHKQWTRSKEQNDIAFNKSNIMNKGRCSNVMSSYSTIILIQLIHIAVHQL